MCKPVFCSVARCAGAEAQAPDSIRLRWVEFRSVPCGETGENPPGARGAWRAGGRSADSPAELAVCPCAREAEQPQCSGPCPGRAAPGRSDSPFKTVQLHRFNFGTTSFTRVLC